jgi:Zn-dependent membrane protease YugP
MFFDPVYLMFALPGLVLAMFASMRTKSTFAKYSKVTSASGMTGAAVAFSIITLPVEWDASKRAKLLMVESGIVSRQESNHAAEVLNAAFMTYVAAAVSSLLTLLYYLMRAGVFGRRDD